MFGERSRAGRFGTLILTSLIAVGVSAGLALISPDWLQRLELKTWDHRLDKLAEPPSDDSMIHLIVVDEESLAWGEEDGFGAWPWPREILQTVLDFCSRGSARAIVFVLGMVEEDPFGGDRDFAASMVRPGSSPAILGLLTTSVESVGEGYVDRWQGRESSRFRVDLSSDPEKRALYTVLAAKFPPPVLIDSASTLGHFLSLADVDGVVRGLKPFLLFDDEAVPSLGLAAYGVTEGATEEREPKTPGMLLEGRSLRFGRRVVPLDDRGNMALRFRKLDNGHRYRFPSHKIEDVIGGYRRLKRGEAEPDLYPGVFKDRYVFLGRVEEDQGTALVGSMTKLELVATMLDNFLEEDFIYPLSWQAKYALTTLLALACALSTAVARRGRQSAAVVAAWAAVPWIIAWSAYPRGYFWPIVEPVFAVALAGFGTVLVEHATARRKAAPGRQIAPSSAGVTEPTGPAEITEEATFDVFLSHNSKNKPTVRELADALEARGLRVWLDERESVPGRRWQDALEEIIGSAGSAAVLVGEDGLGPWETVEMRGCLSELVDRDAPVIPVLLPGAPRRPELPLFLRQVTWVDLRDGLSDEGLDRLEWGITGIKPGSR